MTTETIKKPGIDELLERLMNEKFNGKAPEWKAGGKWCDVNVSAAEDDKNWYYQHGNVIYVQSKSSPENKEPHCYGCGSKLGLVGQRCSVHYKEFGSAMAGGGEVRTKLIPYCPNCESKPSESGFITE